MQTTTSDTQQAARPPFELQSYADATLPTGQRLLDEEHLQGHTIKAVISAPRGRLGDQVDMVIVTETLCWLVLETSDSYCSEERSSVQVRQCMGGRWSHSTQAPKPAETLHDYLSAEQMLRHGLVSHGQHAALVIIEKEVKEKERNEKAEQLRKELAKLEGGAA